MKYLCTFLFTIMISLSLSAQLKIPDYQVNGQIIEKISGKSVPYATIIFKNDSISEKRVMACDASGRFTMNLSKPVVYMLTVSSVGYKEIRMPVNISGQNTDLGKLYMDEGVELKEITVTAQKPLVKVDVDKIVYSMESDPDAQSNNALEMLRKVPLITVDAEENITLNGQSNFKVLVNGKSSSMMSSNLKEVLKSFPANTIKDIEVITNPPSKYDAEGVGGIINIITTKKTINGYNGSIGTGVDSRGSINGNLYLAAKIKKFSFSARYYGSQFKQPDSESNSSGEYYNNTDYHYSNSHTVFSYDGLSNGFSGEASYDIDTLNLISLSFWGYQGSYQSNSFSETKYLNTSDVITRMYTSSTDSKNSFGALSGNIDYQKTFKKPDQSLTFSYLLDNNPEYTKYIADIKGINNYPSYRQRSENDAIGREQTFQADYYDPLTKKHQIEGGVKFILRQNVSNSDIYRNDTVKLTTGNDLDYDQYILGAYAGYVIKWEKVSAKGGFRLERTWNDGVSKTSGVNTDFTNRLFNMVPYVTISYMPKAGQTIKMSYTQRLSRPDIWYLNPYVQNSDSMNISYGNPLLKAEVAHSFELGYTYFTPKFNLSATSFASFVNNSIERISTVQSSGATMNTYENIGKNQSYGLNLYLSYRPTENLSLNFNGSGNYSKLEANTDYDISNEGFFYRGSLGGRLTLWKDGSLNVYSGVYSPRIMLQGKSSSYFYTSFGVSQYMLKRKLMLSLSATDPFWYKKKYKFESNDMTFSSHSESIQLAQTVRLSLTYNFGQMNLEVKKARRGIRNDDVKSGGNSQGGNVVQQ